MHDWRTSSRWLFWLVFAAQSGLAAGANAQPGPSKFDREVAPILIRRCLECHNQRVASGGLVLAEGEAARAGGDSGAAWEPGKPEASLLIQRVTSGEMPPPRQGHARPLPDAELKALRRWIEQGASWPAERTLDLYEATSDVRGGRDWWSLQPVRRPTPPPVKSVQRPVNPIDAFILARLESRQMEPAPAADRRVLIRRAYHDLIGLPPTHREIEDFVADDAPGAWARIVDRLLGSPHYGERWARHWLDVVRFAETSGYERDQPKLHAWKYRDWVVAALNQDLPYDRFVLEQLAGDELPDRSKATVTATGFLRLGTWNDEPNEPEDYQFDRLEDLVHATSSAFLGLTVKCARCHDHKFDPIPQQDYYRMASVFWAGPIRPRDRALLGGPSNQELGFDDVLGWTDVTAQPDPLPLLKNGDRHQPRQAVAPAPMSAVPAIFQPFQDPPPGAKTSRRRLQLAQWIARPDNPLTARVMVNRIWQHHFGQGLVRSPNNFGFRGQPPTHPLLLDWLADEFVAGGWRLKRMHRMLLMSNTYQQSSLHPRETEYRRRDFANHFWWRAERRRHSAESLRDALLAAAGQLDLKLGGPSFRPEIQPEALEGLSRKAAAWQASAEAEQRRRSLYIFTQRSLLVPMMTTFDFHDTTLPCGQRDVTTVAPQALALLNSRFSHECSRRLAERVLQASPPDDAARIVTAWTLTLGRRPKLAEIELARRHLDEQRERFRQPPRGETDPRPSTPLDPDGLAWASLCHVLLNCNEFLYID